ncbi:MAG: hypothetical protein L6Q97_27220 [Thermoanaerobaculia bacterium]|nr:hypothetical protein [Thermoanaerobaculia bacterium]
MPYTARPRPNYRPAFIENALWFAEAAARREGVLRIALLGSITTPKPHPKDVDLLVMLKTGTPFKPISDLARKLSGKQMSVGDSSGADVFLVNEKGEYLGRTCHYRECHYRARCEGQHCGPDSYLCDDFHIFQLRTEFIVRPPVELYPRMIVRAPLPPDLQEALEVYRGKWFPGEEILVEGI